MSNQSDQKWEKLCRFGWYGRLGMHGVGMGQEILKMTMNVGRNNATPYKRYFRFVKKDKSLSNKSGIIGLWEETDPLWQRVCGRCRKIKKYSWPSLPSCTILLPTNRMMLQQRLLVGSNLNSIIWWQRSWFAWQPYCSKFRSDHALNPAFLNQAKVTIYGKGIGNEYSFWSVGICGSLTTRTIHSGSSFKDGSIRLYVIDYEPVRRENRYREFNAYIA